MSAAADQLGPWWPRWRRPIDCDHNATTPVAPTVRRQMARALRRYPGNPSAAHAEGRRARAAIEAARATVAAAVGAAPDELWFTSGATEANNQVLRMLAAARPAGRNRILCSPIEHASVAATLDELASEGLEVVHVPVDRHGRVDPAAVTAAIDERTFLLCWMLVNNELGTIAPLAELSRVARARGLWVMADCAQALGKIPVNVQALGLDAATFAAHKLHGPKGIGAAFVRAGLPRAPLLHGGQQEAGLRPGTEAVHNIVGFAAACRRIPRLLAAQARVAARRDELLAGLRDACPQLVVHTPLDDAVANTLSVALVGHGSAELLAALDEHGVAVAAGSACSAGSGRPSRVLLAVGLDEQLARQTLRISLGCDMSRADVRRVRAAFAAVLAGQGAAVTWRRPADVDAAYLADPGNVVVDVRFGFERVLMAGLPGALELPLFGFARHVDRVPRDRSVLVVCSSGVDAIVAARQLQRRGYARVEVLAGGVIAWRLLASGSAGASAAGRV